MDTVSVYSSLFTVWAQIETVRRNNCKKRDTTTPMKLDLNFARSMVFEGPFASPIT